MKIAKAKMESTVTARVFHADGTVEDLGVIASSVPKWKRFLRRVIHHGK